MSHDRFRKLRKPGAISPHRREARSRLDALEVRARVAGSPRQRDVLWAELRQLSIALRSAEDADPERARCAALQTELLTHDRAEFEPLQRALAEGRFSPEDFSARLAAMPQHDWDPFAQRLFDAHRIPDPDLIKGAQMVEYVATNLRSILEVMEALRPDDVFVDLGSGLGMVTMLAAWLVGVRALGVEIDKAYCDQARATAARLGIERARFLNVDAREAPLEEGTVFYMYQPFHGEVMQAVLAKLQARAQRSLRILSLGLSSRALGAQPWLRLEQVSPSGVSLFVRDRAE